MTARKFHWAFTIFLIMVVCASLLNIRLVHADGETPTEPPAPTQVETEPPSEPPVESMPKPAATEAPAATQPPAETTPEPAVTEAPVATEPPAETTSEPDATETPTEIIAQVPEDIEVVVLDENGDTVPLASQEAADITEVVDPMWCPEGVLPGGSGCTTNFASINTLLTDMATNPTTYAQNGVIYFTASPGAGTLTLTDTLLGGTAFDTLKNHNLTLQGGWNGLNDGSGYALSGQSTFTNKPITIGTSANPWVGNIILNDILVRNVTSANGITVYTSTGDITLDNVDVENQRGGYQTALLESNSGDITVQAGSTFDGDNTGGDTSSGFSATTTTGSITLAGTDTDADHNIQFNDSSGDSGANYNGATLSAPNISLSYVYANGNDGNGVSISNGSLVSVFASAATHNGENGFLFSNSSSIDLNEVYSGYANNNGNGLSGVRIDGTGSTVVTVSGGMFADNGSYGIELYNGQLFILSPTDCPTTGNTANGLGCYNVIPTTDTTAPVITPNVSGALGANGWYTGNVSVSWTVSDPESGVSSSTGCTSSNLSADTAGVTLTCSATNGLGLSASVSTTVKIDQTGPVVTFANRTAPNGNGWNNADVTVNWSCTDALSGAVTTNVSQTVTTEGAGQSATGTCTDNAGNTASDTQGGINIDKTVPSLNLPTPITAEATSAAGAVVGYSASATDNLDGAVSASCSPASGSTFSLGTTPVVCSATDLAGNTATGGFQVTVQDTTPPTLNLPANITVSTTGISEAVTYSASATDAVDGPLAVSCSPASGTFFTLGSTTVNCSATDAHSNTGSGSFTVNVQNADGPIISVPANITAEATSASGAAVSYSASATDVVDGNVTVSCLPASGSTFPLGTNTVNCSATDSDSHTSTASFLVTVQDTTAPSIAPLANLTVTSNSSSGIVVNYSNPSTLDSVDGSGSASCSPASGSLFPVGNTTVVCTATDSAANTAFSTFTVQVNQASTPSTPGSSNTPSNSKPNNTLLNIPVTGGGTVRLDCNSVFMAFGVKLSFQNLCDDQATLDDVNTGNLPGALPEGFSFVMGLDVNVLIENQLVEELPDGTGIQMDFPILGNSDQFVVLHWDGSQWIEVPPATGSAQGSYQILTTDQTGIFVLAKK